MTYDVQFEWGSSGASALVAGVDVTIVVDVLSFTTTLSVALDVGTVVLPYPWDDESAVDFAAEHDAVLAVGRSAAGPGQVSLSPQSIRAGQAPGRLVLPSPNGSTIAHQLGSTSAPCLGSCLRNAGAVASWVCSNFAPGTASVAVIAAGERWADGSLRPAVEDLWGAGAVIAGLAERGWSELSPEADTARAGYEWVRGRERPALLGCHSGVELIERGYQADVEIAAEVDLSHSVPYLDGDRFRHAIME